MIKAIVFDFFGVICTYVGFDNVVVLNRELLELVAKLKPKYKTAILSNANQEFIEQALAQNQAKELFDAVITSSKTGLVKPQPEIFKLALEQVQSQPAKTLFIDDSSSNVAAAKELGMHSVLYSGLENLQKELKLKKVE